MCFDGSTEATTAHGPPSACRVNWYREGALLVIVGWLTVSNACGGAEEKPGCEKQATPPARPLLLGEITPEFACELYGAPERVEQLARGGELWTYSADSDRVRTIQFCDGRVRVILRTLPTRLDTLRRCAPRAY